MMNDHRQNPIPMKAMSRSEMDSCYRCYGMTTSRCDMTTSHSSHHGMPVAKHGPTKVPKGVHFQLDLPDAKP